MALLGRKPPVAPQQPPCCASCATLTARHDQALTLVDELVRTVRPGSLVPGRHVADWLLDVRNALNPPTGEAPGA